MVSKIIMDSPGILEESLVTLTEACRCFPVRCSRPAIERWLRRGSRGIVLESILICGKRYTSREAIDRFVRGQLHVEPEFARPGTKSSMSKKELEAGLKKFNLPLPQNANKDNSHLQN